MYILQGAFTRRQVMHLAPEVAAILGIPTTQVDFALAAALTAAGDEDADQGDGMLLDLCHECK